MFQEQCQMGNDKPKQEQKKGPLDLKINKVIDDSVDGTEEM